jgi:hypothetical protein
LRQDGSSTSDRNMSDKSSGQKTSASAKSTGTDPAPPTVNAKPVMRRATTRLDLNI